MSTTKYRLKKKCASMETCCRFLYVVICGPSNYGKINVLISLLESSHGIRFENVYVYSKSLQQPKYWFLKNLLAPVEEISYFIFSNNSDVISLNEALLNSIFIFDDVACDKTRSESTLQWVDTRTVSIYVRRMQRYWSILYASDNANLLILFKQDDTGW